MNLPCRFDDLRTSALQVLLHPALLLCIASIILALYVIYPRFTYISFQLHEFINLINLTLNPVQYLKHCKLLHHLQTSDFCFLYKSPYHLYIERKVMTLHKSLSNSSIYFGPFTKTHIFHHCFNIVRIT